MVFLNSEYWRENVLASLQENSKKMTVKALNTKIDHKHEEIFSHFCHNLTMSDSDSSATPNTYRYDQADPLVSSDSELINSGESSSALSSPPVAAESSTTRSSSVKETSSASAQKARSNSKGLTEANERRLLEVIEANGGIRGPWNNNRQCVKYLLSLVQSSHSFSANHKKLSDRVRYYTQKFTKFEYLAVLEAFGVDHHTQRKKKGTTPAAATPSKKKQVCFQAFQY